MTGRKNLVHGDAAGERHPLYKTWEQMKSRCRNPNDRLHTNHGGRGITVCDEWLEWVPFRDYILEHLGPRPEGHTLDRIDNDSGYLPGNLKWSTASERRRNQRPRQLQRAE